MRSVTPNLPSLPPAKAQAIALLANEHADPADLADAVLLDPSLSASVLRGANSASSAPVSPVTSVEVAVVRLGTVEVRRIVAAALLGQGFGGLQRSDVDVDEMWRHVIVTALLAERLVAEEQTRQAFTAGILHDLGRLVMIASDAAAYADVVRRVREGADARDAERAAFELDHCELGAETAAAWDFPDELVAAIAQHHDGGTPLADAVSNARRIGLALGVGDGVALSPEAPRNTEASDDEPSDAAIVELLGGEDELHRRVSWFRETLRAA